MNSLFEKLLAAIRWPIDAIFGEKGLLGTSAGRSRSLMLGLPAILFALTGVLLLVFAQVSLDKSLESVYQGRLAASNEEKVRLAKELELEIKLQLASQQVVTETTLDDLVSPEDERRVNLKRARDEERVYLQKLNAINPEDDEYLFKLAKVTIEDNQADRGLAMVRKISPVSEPGYIPGHLFLANYHLRKASTVQPGRRLQQVNVVIRHLKNILLREPNNKQALILLGSIYHKQHNYTAAYPHFYTLFKGDPSGFRTVVELNKRLDREYENVHVLNEASDFFRSKLRELRRDDDQRIVMLKNMTDCYRMQKDFDAAESMLKNEIKTYARVADDASRLLWTKKLLSSIYVSWSISFLGEDYDAVKKRLGFLKLAMKYDLENADAQRSLTRIAYMEFPDLAQESLEIYSALDHPDAPAVVINELGIQALSRSRYEDALRYFTVAHRKAEKNPEILNNLAYTHLKSETPNPKLALKLIDDALRFTPPAALEKYRSNFLDTRARAYMQLKQYNSAIADFTRAWSDRKESLEIMEAIIECYYANDMASNAATWELKLEDEKKRQAKRLANPNAQPRGGDSTSKE